MLNVNTVYLIKYGEAFNKIKKYVFNNLGFIKHTCAFLSAAKAQGGCKGIPVGMFKRGVIIFLFLSPPLSG